VTRLRAVALLAVVLIFTWAAPLALAAGQAVQTASESRDALAGDMRLLMWIVGLAVTSAITVAIAVAGAHRSQARSFETKFDKHTARLELAATELRDSLKSAEDGWGARIEKLRTTLEGLRVDLVRGMGRYDVLEGRYDAAIERLRNIERRLDRVEGSDQ
jgi:hypothetical protein